MSTTSLTLDTPDGPMPTFQAAPDGEARGGIVVVQEAFGVTAHIESICRRLAEAGWLAVAPAMFHRQGSPVLRYDDMPAVMPLMGQLSAAGIGADVDAALAHLSSVGFDASRQGIVGFCMGGTVAVQSAATCAIGAAVTFYGGGLAEGRFGYPAVIDVADALRTPWLGLFGDLDQSIPPDQVEALRERAATAGVETEIVRYPDAGHGFNCNDRPAAFNADAAADAWSRTLAWFDAHLGAS